ncbi:MULTISPECIES: isocitrate lyase/PEP mutase family protein [Bacteria]|jgi:2-methylisocitrate lyase-like PEP mutase family enzyme|uniref:2-Methylisocitrate lyase, PEP mutase family n=1 Tax=Janibacter indicus TaxID=857417 RepID=A0A1W2C8U6_9MICO|nr:isocitrate lyase/phosphoenolpyruvate mutase family protein [Janibacter indicus]QOK21301.1 isocitrate lyase/phosphoenolpyruvate mutase family protein [Janibacter indicus]SMC81098.1 2-Methylisocitrate lyase, PEP mutase family [Janibacter indicus]
METTPSNSPESTDQPLGTVEQRAADLLALHRAPELLTVVNVWDAISAKVVTEVPGTAALATASHSIAATLGWPDGEVIPLAEMLDMCRRIVAATHLPVTADLEGGYGDAAGTVRAAIELGIVGANIEDQMKPLDQAAEQVAAIMAAAREAGVPSFVLNARTDTFLRAGDRSPSAILDDAVERGRAYLAAGAPVVFVPGKLGEEQIATLVEAYGPQRLSTIAVPGSVPLARQAELGVARVSYGPNPQRVALTALADLAAEVLAGGALPENMRILN